MSNRAQIRIVTGDPPAQMDMATAIDAMATECKAALPTVVMLIWETPSRGKDESYLSCRTAPASMALMKGIVGELYDRFFDSGTAE